MKITLINYTPLHICSAAIRKCWSSENKSDSKKHYNTADNEYIGTICGPKDKDLIERVGNKYKHSSTLEHLCLCVNIDDDIVAQTFKEDNYSTVTGTTGNWIISTNVRALQNIELSLKNKRLLIPKEYVYLFK